MKLPKNWNDISLNQFKKLTEINQDALEITKFIETLSAVTNVSRDKIDGLTYKKAIELINKLKFVYKLPEAEKHEWLFFKNRFFRLKPIEELSNRDFVDLNEIVEADINEAEKVAKMMLILLRVKGRAQIKEWEFFMEMPMGKSYSLMLFFYNIVKSYSSKLSEGYLQEMTLKEILMKEKSKQ